MVDLQQQNSEHIHSAQFHFSRHAPIPAQLPNLFHATFEQGRKPSAGETYLCKTIREFDAGGKRKRKAILEGFLEYVGRESRCGVEDAFRHQAHLFFMRLTSWFSVSLPMFYELPLQLKVFQAFLEFHEQVFVEAFFESGVVVPLMHTLSVSFDVADEVRCLSLVVLQKLAANGRHCKELLCANHLVDRVVECVSDGLKWETLKQAGKLLCELFRGNPLHQTEVLDALQSLLAHRLPITQRIGCQSLIALLSEGSHNPLLREKERHNALTTQALTLLESHDIRVGADAYCLLCRLVECFQCDSLLFSFARAQLRTEKECTDEWLRLELEAQKHHEHGGSVDHVDADGSNVMPFGGRLQGTTNCLRRRIVENLQKGSGNEDDTFEEAQKNNAEFRTAFSAEAGHLLKWGVLLFLVKRNNGLCAELVDHGLTETLLMCLLDVSQPVRQAAALTELHRLRLLSKRAEVIAESVLVKKELLSAMSLHDFMSKATEADHQRARYLLRNMQASDRRNAYSAKEFALQQSLLEKDMTGILQDQDAAPVLAKNFLTEVPEETKEDQKIDEEAAEGVAPAASKERSLAATGAVEEVPEVPVEDKVQQKEDEVIPRFGKDTIPVQRVPESKSGMGLNKEDYKLEVPLVEEIPFCGSLSSLLFDPLELTADEESPLVQEVRGVAAVGSMRKATDTARAQPLSSRRAGPKKPSHRPGPSLTRALALNRNLDLRPKLCEKGPTTTRSMSVTPSVCSDLTELSVRCGNPEESSIMCRHGPYGSMQETTVGPDISNEFSRELPSTEYHSISRDLNLDGGPSIFSDGHGYDALDREMAQHGTSQMSHMSDHDHGSCGGCGGHHHAHQSIGDRSTVVTAIDHSGVRIPGKPTVNRKRVLHVAPAVAHDCLVFDKSEQEKQRQKCADSISKLLHPKTQQLFADLKGAGGFPRRFTRRHMSAQPPFSSRGMDSAAASQPAPRVPSRGIGFSAGQPVGETPVSDNTDQNVLPPLHARLANGGGDLDMLRAVFPASHMSAMTAR